MNLSKKEKVRRCLMLHRGETLALSDIMGMVSSQVWTRNALCQVVKGFDGIEKVPNPVYRGESLWKIPENFGQKEGEGDGES